MATKMFPVIVGLALSIMTAYSLSWAVDGLSPEAGKHPFQLSAPPQKGDIMQLDTAQTEVSFTIVSNSAGPITGRFVQGTKGWIDVTDKKHPKAHIAIQLDTLKSFNAKGDGNPMRDMNVIEAFFGVRDSATQKEPVKQVWTKLSPYLKPYVPTAGFELTGVSINGANAGTRVMGSAEAIGNLYFWDSISVKARFPIDFREQNNQLTIKSTKPFVFDLEKVLGSQVRALAFDTLLAAGCAHQPGIQNQVSISLDKVVFKFRK